MEGFECLEKHPTGYSFHPNTFWMSRYNIGYRLFIHRACVLIRKYLDSKVPATVFCIKRLLPPGENSDWSREGIFVTDATRLSFFNFFIKEEELELINFRRLN
jgi:hypothetical protein